MVVEEEVKTLLRKGHGSSNVGVEAGCEGFVGLFKEGFLGRVFDVVDCHGEL